MTPKIFRATIDHELQQEAAEAAMRLFGHDPAMRSWRRRMEAILNREVPRCRDVAVVLFACCELCDASWIESAQGQYMEPEFLTDVSRLWRYWDFYFADRRSDSFQEMREVLLRVGEYADGWERMAAVEAS